MGSELFDCPTNVDNFPFVETYPLIHMDNYVDKVIHKLSTPQGYVDNSNRQLFHTF